MKPIEALTSLPRSPEIARIVATEARHGEVVAHGHMQSMIKEALKHEATVGETMKTVTDNRADAEGSGGGTPGRNGPSDGRRDGDRGSAQGESPHPSKGKILDIKGV